MPTRTLALSTVLLALAALAATACAPMESGATMGSLLRARAPGHVEQGVHEVCPDGDTTFGVDVSDYQNTIDWSQAAGAGGVKFAFIRVSDGLGFPDSEYDANWPGAKAAGVLRGTYQFFRSNEDPIAQADLLLSHMGALEPGDLPPVADVESTDNTDNATRAANLHQWLDHVSQALGVTPIIYTGGYYWQDSVGDDFSQYPLWHAGYTGGTCPSTIADQWPGWDFWQYSSTANVAGIPDATDADTFNGDITKLQKLGVGTAVCGDGFCSGGENHDSCAGDCPVCEAIPASGGEISEQGLCFVGGGPQQFMRRVSDAGEDGDLIWTHTTADASEANFGTWTILLSEHGHYKIEAYTAAAYAQSKQANYVLHHGSSDDSHVIDQTAVDGFNLVVDDVELDPADGVTLHLADNTGEDGSGNVQLVFDAIKLTRLDTPVVGEGEGSAGGEGEGEGAGIQRVVIEAPPAAASCSGSGTTSSSAPLACLSLLVVAFSRCRKSAR